MVTDDSWAANPRDDCYFCRDDCDVLEEHHLVPRRHGGGDEARNLVTLCPTCHEKLERLYDRRFYQALGIGEPDDVVQHIADYLLSELEMLELDVVNSLRRTQDRIDGTYLDGQGINEDLHSRIETAVSAYYRAENSYEEFDAEIVGQNGWPSSDGGKVKRMVELLEQEYADGAPRKELFQELESIGLKTDEIDHLIEKLRRQAEIYEPAEDHFRAM